MTNDEYVNVIQCECVHVGFDYSGLEWDHYLLGISSKDTDIRLEGP